MVGQNVVNNFFGCAVQRGTITGTGLAYGFYCDTVSGESTQSQRFIGCSAYEYDYNVYLSFALETQIEACDLSQAKQICVVVGTVLGNTNIRDNWIETFNAATAATTGIQVQAAGSVPYLIDISGNHITCDLSYTGSIGISVGSGALGVRANNNRIENFETAISNTANNFVSQNNSIRASGAAWNNSVTYAVGSLVYIGGAPGTVYKCILANTNQTPPNATYWQVVTTPTAVLLNSLAADCTIGPNFVEAGLQLSFTALTPPGLSYFGRGQFTLTLNGMNGGGTISGTCYWAANGHGVTLSVPNTETFTGTSAATTMVGTGLPQWLWPVQDQAAMAVTVDNGTTTYGSVVIAAASGNMTYHKDANGTAFTGSGTKGINSGSVTYTLQ